MKKLVFDFISDLIGLSGVGLVITAAWMIYPPAAVALAGAFLIFLGYHLSK
jgi:hypothetical protein